MAAMLPKSLSRGSPRKASLGPAEASESAASEAPGSRTVASAAMAPATAHEAAVASDSGRGVDDWGPAEHAHQAPAFAARQEIEAALDRNNLAEATSSAMTARQQQGHNVKEHAGSESHTARPAPQVPESAPTQHEVAAARDRHQPAAPQLVPEPVAFAAPHEIAAAQDRQYPTEYTAAAMGESPRKGSDNDESVAQPESSPRQHASEAFAPQQGSASDQNNLAGSASAVMTAQTPGLDSRESAPRSEPASAQPDSHSGLPGVIEVAAPVNGLRREAAEQEAQGTTPPLPR